MQKLFLCVLDMSLTAGLVIPAVLLVRLPLKRAPRVFTCLLWLAVLLRLLCPLAPESPVSLIPAQVRTLSGSIVPAESGRLSAPPAAQDAAGTAEEAAGGPAAVSGECGPLWLTLALRLWPLGTAALLLWGAVSLLRLRRRVAGAVPLEPGVFLADHIPTAFVLGLLRPRIYLPSSLTDTERNCVLLHERTHLRRLDHVFRLLAFLALALHWYNPLVWLAYVLSGRDMEMACDEAVLRRAGMGFRADYCQALLDLSTGRRSPVLPPLAFARGDTAARIRNALRARRPSLWVCAGALLLVAAAGVLLLTDPLSPKTNRVQISFPAYQGGRDLSSPELEPWFDRVYGAEAFTVSLELPEGWTVALPPEEEQRIDASGLAFGCPLYTPVYLLDETGGYVGFMGWYGFEPYTGDDVPAGEEYKTVYAPFRLGAHYMWCDFVSVAGTDTGESHTVSVYYQLPREDEPAAMWTTREAAGACCCDTELGVLVGIQLDRNSVTRSQQTAIAQSLKLG